jgi:branched-chain amino acid transport system permease protein
MPERYRGDALITLLGQLIIDGIVTGLVYVILAVGLVLILSVSRIFFIAYGQFYMLGAYIVWGSLTLLKVPYFVGLLTAIASTTLLGLLCYQFIFRYIQYRGSFLANIVAAVGLMMIMGQAGLLIFGTIARSVPPVFPGIFSIANISIPVEKLVLVILTVCIALIAFFIYEKMKLGRAMRAVSLHPEAATLQGVKTNRIYLATMGFGCALAGFGGGVMAPVYVIYPEMGTNIILSVLLVIMLGGQGSMLGAVLGGLVLGITLVFGQYFLGGLAQIFLFVVIGIILFFRPGGLLGHAEFEI